MDSRFPESFQPHKPMNHQQHLESELSEISDLVWSLAKQCQDDPNLLLELLRTLELLHRQIREELFQPSLPNTRNALYTLLRDIEEQGGWPYVPRMKIQELCLNLLLEKTQETPESTSVPDS